MTTNDIAGLCEFIRSTWPLTPTLGPVTYGQRAKLHEAATALAELSAKLDAQEGVADRAHSELAKADEALTTASARIAELEAALVSEREGNLWNAYNSGHVKDAQWTHMFMSDGEWLARECGFDPKAGFYDDQAIRNAIPIAARAALERKP